MPADLAKSELLHVVTQSVLDSGCGLICLDRNHPFRIRIYYDDKSRDAKIIIYNISHGGKKRAEDEYRIQIKEIGIEPEAECKTIILGYHSRMEVFAGWDASKHPSPKYSSSLQIRLEALEKASMYGFSTCDKGNGEIVVAFKPGLMSEYIRNLEDLHSFGESVYDLNILEEATGAKGPNMDMDIQGISPERRTVLQTILKRQRDSSFRERILSAYNHRCAFSGVQLKLVDAAHIIPVRCQGATDETDNGIALSAIHHKAYDRGLITFDENYKIKVNEGELHRLQDLDLIGGFNEFKACLRDVIYLPSEKTLRPNPEYVRRANELRGWAV